MENPGFLMECMLFNPLLILSSLLLTLSSPLLILWSPLLILLNPLPILLSAQEPSTQQVLPGGSASSICPNAIVDGSDDETEQTWTDGEMVVEEDFDVEETLDASFEEDSCGEDANFEEDDINVAISGEEHKDEDSNLCMVTAPGYHNLQDHINCDCCLGQADKHINNEG
ncbi:hypothetical protein EV424DRAFT_1531931 [Suillus variegatus]|nr:hypothetical protein EV424DRAFT_1531931 [Suillus variegatus]